MMKLAEYIEQLKKDADRIEKDDLYTKAYVNPVLASLIRDIAEDLEKIEEERNA